MYTCKRASRCAVLLMTIVFITSCGSDRTTKNAVPTLSSISPTSAVAGSPAFTLTVNGSGFVSASTVQWNGTARPTTFVSSTQLTAAIPATDIGTSGTATIAVSSPGTRWRNIVRHKFHHPGAESHTHDLESFAHQRCCGQCRVHADG